MATGFLGAIGKFAKGVSDVAVPAALEQHRANILAKRDSVLQGFEMQQQTMQQEFTKGENDRQRTLTREENKADRDARASEFGVTTGIRQEELGMERQKLDTVLAAAEQALKKGDIELKQLQQVQNLHDIAIDPDVDPAERQRAIDALDTLKDETGKFSAVYFDKLDESGYPTGGRDTFIMNNRSGTLNDPRGAIGLATGQPANPQTDEEYNALPSGALFIDPEDGKTYRKP